MRLSLTAAVLFAGLAALCGLPAAHAGDESTAPRVTVAQHADGMTVLFLKGPDSALWVKHEVAQRTDPGARTIEEQRDHRKTWTRWMRVGGVMTSPPSVGRNADGSLEVFFRGADNTLFSVAQDGPNARKFGSVRRIGTPKFRFAAHPVVATQADGRLTVFALSVKDSSLHFITQASSPKDGKQSAWPTGAWKTLGGKWRGVPAAGLNSDGTMVVMVRSRHGFLFTARQKQPSSPLWHLWHNAGGKLLGSPVIGRNEDGTLQVYARFVDNRLWTLLQNGASTDKWHKWRTIGGEVTTDPTVLLREDGTQEVFARFTDNKAYHKWQKGRNSQDWTKWYSMGGALNSQLSAVLRNSLIEVYGVGNDNTVLFKKQALHIEWKWTDWISHSGRLVGDPELVVNRKGRAYAFMRGDGNALFVAWQLTLTDTQKWSAWHNLGGQLSSDPSVVLREDDTLAVFVAGYDNSLWTCKQVRADDPKSFTRVTRLGGHIIGKPAVVVADSGRLAVFARGIDNSLSHLVEVTLPPGAKKGEDDGADRDGDAGRFKWSDWASLGGRLESAPSAAMDRWGALHVFVRGTGNSLRYLRQRPVKKAASGAGSGGSEVWDSWMEITGLTLGGSPVVSHDRHGRLGVLVMDSEHRLQASFQEAEQAWTAWETVGEPEQAKSLSWFGRPAVTRDARGRFMILAKGADSRVYGCSYVGGPKRWSTWRPIEGVKISGAPVFASYPSGVLMILGRGTSNALWAKQYGVYVTDSAEDWSPWVSLGGRLAA